MTNKILEVAIPTPVRKTFDYLPPDNVSDKHLKPGIRIYVPFGRQKKCVGLIINIRNHTSIHYDKLKKALSLIDDMPVLDKTQLNLLTWASHYYHYPIGEVILSSLPSLLRKGNTCSYPIEYSFQITETEDPFLSIKQNTKQYYLLKKLSSQNNQKITLSEIKLWNEYSSYALKALIDKNIVYRKHHSKNVITDAKPDYISLPETTKDQKNVIEKILPLQNEFQCHLLNGVTGSGKTHVYMQLTRQNFENNKQTLLLLPEISLTPQFIQRFTDVFKTSIAVYHSNLTDQQRLITWLQARDNSVKIVIGTRSAIWLPFKSLGLIIVDEEHDLSYKQQEGFRYSARDVAVYRAQKNKIPVLLGSATPSMETLNNSRNERYTEHQLFNRIGEACLPKIDVVDLKKSTMYGALSDKLIEAIRKTLSSNLQVLLFLNQRGFAPAMLCHDCGHVMHCERCDKPMTLHKHRKLIWCHHCDKQLPEQTNCPQCQQQNWIEVGHGTERIEQDMAKIFPEQKIIRIDRDTTRKKGELARHLDSVKNSDAKILIGTQMLAKGHDFKDLALVGIVDMDSGLYSTDYRASERMAQLFIQVSGRAGRADAEGRVILQTHHPEHPLLNILINEGYNAFADLLLQQRKEASLPPFIFQALLRAEATDSTQLNSFLNQIKKEFESVSQQTSIFGPMQSIMPRKAGKYRMQLLLEDHSRSGLSNSISSWIKIIERLKTSKRVRWSLDVDPQDMI